MNLRAVATFALAVALLHGLAWADDRPGEERYRLDLPGLEAIAVPDARPSSAEEPTKATLVLVRREGRWQPTLAGDFRRGPGSQGMRAARGYVRSAEPRSDGWHVEVELLIGGLPRRRDWLTRDLPLTAVVTMDLTVSDGKVTGSWKAVADGTAAEGKLAGVVEALRAWDMPPAARPGEHPRFLIRREQLADLKRRAATDWGRAMVERMKQPGWSRSGSAVAWGLLYQLTGEKAHAAKARELIDADIASGWWRTLGPIHDPAHKATEAMLAWDLIYDTCDDAYNARMRAFLRDKMRFLYDYGEINSGNGHPHSNWSAQYRAATGMVALALLADEADFPEPPDDWKIPAIAPPEGFTPAEGAPVLPVGEAPLRKWLFTGPLNVGIGRDALAGLGGEANARPGAATRFTTKVKPQPRQGPLCGKYRSQIAFKNARPRPQNYDVQGDDLQPLTSSQEFSFGPVPEQAVVSKGEYQAPEGWIALWRAAGLKGFQTMYFYAVLDNPSERALQVKLSGRRDQHDWKFADSCLYISGRRFEHADVLKLSAGKHPVLRKVTISTLRLAHFRDRLYDEVFLEPLDEAAAATAERVRNTEAGFRRRYLAALKPHFEPLGRPDPDALLWLPLAQDMMARYATAAISEKGWHSAGQCYTQHPLRVAMPFAHAWRNAQGTEIAADQNLGWFLAQATARTVFSDKWARMQDYGRGGGPVGVDVFARGFASVPPKLRPAVAWAWRRTLDLADRKLFQAPEGAIESLDPMSAAFTLVNAPAEMISGMGGGDPAGALPRALVDSQRLGYTMRNRWRDGDDIVAVFTGFRHPGGDWSCEGAELDLRLMGLGGEWMLPGNGRSGAKETNTVAVLGSRGPTHVRQTHLATAADGSAVVSLAYGLGEKGTGLRSFAVDYSGASGAPVLLILVDRVRFATPAEALANLASKPVKRPDAPELDIGDESADPLVELGPAPDDRKLRPPAPNRWRLVTHRDNHVSADRGSFVIRGSGGARLAGTIVAPGTATPTVAQVTYGIEINYRYDHQSGEFTRKVVSFPGTPAAARGDDDFYFVVMTLGAAEPPAVSVTGSGPDAVVTVGRQKVGFDGRKVVLEQFDSTEAK